MPLVAERETTAAERAARTATPVAVGRDSVKRRTSNLAKAPSIALGTIGFYALHAWVLQVDGETSLARRSMSLALIGATVVGVAWAAARLPYRMRALGMLLIGVVGLSVMGAIVGSHFVKLGIEGRRITGVIAVIAAALLTTVGSVRLIRSARTMPHKLLALPVAFILLQFVVLPLGNAIYATQAAHPQLGNRTLADVGLVYESVTFTSSDGTTLAAWYVPSSNGAAVLLRHGSGSTRTAALDHAAFLAKAGYGVLLTDARGHGESGGRINELGWHGPADIRAALDYLESRPDFSRKTGVLGLSMGAEEALNAAATDERIAAVVAEGPGISNYNDSIADGTHAMARFINWTQYSLTAVLSDAPQPRGILASIPQIAPRPVLLIVGDEAVEKKMGPIYARVGGPTTELWSLSDTPHTDGLRVHPSEYQARVLAILEDALQPLRPTD